LLFVMVMTPYMPKMTEPDVAGEFDYYLPPVGDAMERWKATKAETAPLPAGASIVTAEQFWRGKAFGVPLMVCASEDTLLLLQDQKPLRVWQGGSEIAPLIPQQQLNGTGVVYGLSAGGQHVVALQQSWQGQPRVKRLTTPVVGFGKLADQSWNNVETPGEGWFIEHVKSAAVSDDGAIVAFADNHKGVFVWAASDEQPRKLKLQAMDDARLALSPDGARLLIGEKSGALRLVDLATEQELYTAALQGECVRVSFAPSGSRFFALHRFHTRNAAQVWDLDDSGLVTHRHNFGNYSAEPLGTFSPDSQKLALGGSQADMIQIYDLASGQEVIRLVHRDGVHATSFAFSRDGRRVVADGFFMMQWLLPE
jgi:WD40 repeat protein